MITVQTINQYAPDWEQALADRIAAMVRQDFGVTVIVEVAQLALDPTPYNYKGYRVTRNQAMFLPEFEFDPRSMFEQREEKYA